MKKLFSAFSVALCALAVFAVVNTVSAEEPTRLTCDSAVSIRIHVAQYSELAEDHSVVFYSWGTEGSFNDAFTPSVGEDDFGVYTDICVKAATLATGSAGFIAIDYDHTKEGNDPVGSTTITVKDWTKKVTGNIVPTITTVQDGGMVDVYAYETGSDYVQHGVVVDPTMKTALITYYDPSGAYEENLGLHFWGGWLKADGSALPGPGWASPDTTVLTKYDVDINGIKLYVGTLQTATEGGFLIYAGDDSSKKTGDCNVTAADPVGVKLFSVLGGVGVMDSLAALFEEARNFRFMDYRFEDGQQLGTFGASPNVIMYQFSIPVGVYEEDDASIGAVKGQYILHPLKVYEVTEDGDVELEVLKITSSGSQGAITLANSNLLDVNKTYRIEYIHEESEKDASLELFFDRTAPEITVIGKEIITLKLGASRAEILAAFPQFNVFDDVDGEITSKLFVDGSDKTKCTVDTRVVGVYEIHIFVQDAFGNTNSVIITYNVVR